MYEIYIDVLICTNIFINYFILLAISKLYFFRTNKLRIILGACLGGLCSLLILVPETNFYINLIVKFLISAIIILVSFKITSLINFTKALASFYVVNFIFAGIVLFIWYFLDSKNIFIKNSIVYFNISPLFFIISTLIAYSIIKFLNLFTVQRESKQSFCSLKIEQNNKILKLNAKIDTGNTLKDPFSNKPVAIVEYKFIKDIIPLELREYFLNNAFNNLNINKLAHLKFRAIPFNTILGTGIMPAFMPDKIKITEKGKKETEKDAFIAICKGKIINENYSALVGTDMLA